MDLYYDLQCKGAMAYTHGEIRVQCFVQDEVVHLIISFYQLFTNYQKNVLVKDFL